MRLNKIELWDLKIPFRDGPYRMSHVVQETTFGKVLCLHTDNGICGLGEIVPAPPLEPQERLARYSETLPLLSDLIGEPHTSIKELINALQERDASWNGITFGMETAYYDLLARQSEATFADVLGGARDTSIEDYFSISEEDPARVRVRMAMAGSQRKVIQIKVGVYSLAHELGLIRTALDLMTESQILLADANGGWSPEQAEEAINAIQDTRLIWEEPCQFYEENRNLCRSFDAQILLDGETSRDAETAKRAILDGTAYGMCIKPALVGGLGIARQIRDLCAEAGIKMRIDGPWCGDIASAAIVNLAMGAPPDLLIAGCDLREPLSRDPDLDGLFHAAENRISPSHPYGFDAAEVRRLLGPAERVWN